MNQYNTKYQKQWGQPECAFCIPKIPCKSLIPRATTLRVFADGSKGCRTINLLNCQSVNEESTL
jgi:hypothetical protein